MAARKPRKAPPPHAVGNNGKSSAGRGPDGRFRPGNTEGFQPGQSGNPSGRPRVAKLVREAAGKAAPEMMEILIEAARKGTPVKVRQAKMANLVLDRAVGKAPIILASSMEETDPELGELTIRVVPGRPVEPLAKPEPGEGDDLGDAEDL